MGLLVACDEGGHGAHVLGVRMGGPGARAGVRIGDIIVEANGVSLASLEPDEIIATLERLEGGASIITGRPCDPDAVHAAGADSPPRTAPTEDSPIRRPSWTYRCVICLLMVLLSVCLAWHSADSTESTHALRLSPRRARASFHHHGYQRSTIQHPISTFFIT